MTKRSKKALKIYYRHLQQMGTIIPDRVVLHLIKSMGKKPFYVDLSDSYTLRLVGKSAVWVRLGQGHDRWVTAAVYTRKHLSYRTFRNNEEGNLGYQPVVAQHLGVREAIAFMGHKTRISHRHA